MAERESEAMGEEEKGIGWGCEVPCQWITKPFGETSLQASAFVQSLGYSKLGLENTLMRKSRPTRPESS